MSTEGNPDFSGERPHDPTMILVDYTLNGVAKSFKVGMDRFDELIAWATKEFTDGRDIGGPDLRRDDAKRRSAKR